MNYIPDSGDFISLSKLCEELSISTATGRNWIKLGRITPEYTAQKTAYFTKEYAEDLRNKLQSGHNQALKSRRNKNFISGNVIYASYISDDSINISVVQKLLTMISEEQLVLDSQIIQLLTADCALKLFADKHSGTNCRLNESAASLEHNLPGSLPAFLSLNTQDDLASSWDYYKLISALIPDFKYASTFCQKHPSIFELSYSYEEKEDVLGLIYLSCSNLGNRKAHGTYYTPTSVVRKLTSLIDFRNIKQNPCILDPCCGTGNFLLQLPEHLSFDCIYGSDLDTISVRLARINMALRYNATADQICEHIIEHNYLTPHSHWRCQAPSPDYIIGNPPWGYNFSANEKEELSQLFKTAARKNPESYDMFIEQALRQLPDGGHLTFVLPEAVLNVQSHRKIRELIMQTCRIRNLIYLGDVFDKVQCPSIILDLQRTTSGFNTSGMTVMTAEKNFFIQTERDVSSKYFNFTATDEEYQILQKLENPTEMVYLAGNADFALGIVTGDNKKYLTHDNVPGSEPILTGADINRFHISQPDHYIVFAPELYQQTAPEAKYRAHEKLLYRFIGGQLIFAYDNRQMLSLNSCNIVIPRIKGLDTKYILAVLNSRPAQFLFSKKFNSVKILRSHIENIPIPIPSPDIQAQIVHLADMLIHEQVSGTCVYNELDSFICELYGLERNEIAIIRNAV